MTHGGGREGAIAPRPWIAILVVVATAACDWSRDEEPDGLAPLPAPDVRRLSVEDVHRFATSDELAFVMDLRRTADGTTWVLNSVEPLLVGFDATGRMVRSSGRRGGGPEELRGPHAFLRGEAPGAWLYDQERHLLIDAAAETWTETPLPRGALDPLRLTSFARAIRMGRGIELSVIGSRLLFGLRRDPDGGPLGLWSSTLLALDPESGDVREVVDLAETLEPPEEVFGPADIFLPFPVWGGCRDGDVAIYDPSATVIRWFDGQGREGEAWPLPPPEAEPLSVESMSGWVYRSAVRAQRMLGGPSVDSAAFHADARRALREAGDRIAGVFPEFSDLRCTADGAVWLEHLDAVREPADGARWLRVSDRQARELIFPRDFDPLWFEPDRVWGVLRDELDLPHIAWVAVGPGPE